TIKHSMLTEHVSIIFNKKTKQPLILDGLDNPIIENVLDAYYIPSQDCFILRDIITQACTFYTAEGKKINFPLNSPVTGFSNFENLIRTQNKLFILNNGTFEEKDITEILPYNEYSGEDYSGLGHQANHTNHSHDGLVYGFYGYKNKIKFYDDYLIMPNLKIMKLEKV
ncbi:MAG: hypothetical protein ACPGTS_02295, partial [Minisyncoccia bacterium]